MVSLSNHLSVMLQYHEVTHHSTVRLSVNGINHRFLNNQLAFIRVFCVIRG